MGKTWTAHPPLSGRLSVRVAARIWVVPRKVMPFVPVVGTERLFCIACAQSDIDHAKELCDLMKEQLERSGAEALAAIAGQKAAADLDALRVKYLGKKGELTAVLKQMGKPVCRGAPGHRPAGQRGPRRRWRRPLDRRADRAGRRPLLEAKLEAETRGRHHPRQDRGAGPPAPHEPWCWTRSRRSSWAWALTWSTARRSSWTDYNFDAAEHPRRTTLPGTARTPSISRGQSVLLRTQTSPMQIRAMEKHEAAHPHDLPPAGCTARTRWTPPTPPCSIRSRAWWWTRASPWRT